MNRLVPFSPGSSTGASGMGHGFEVEFHGTAEEGNEKERKNERKNERAVIIIIIIMINEVMMNIE